MNYDYEFWPLAISHELSIINYYLLSFRLFLRQIPPVPSRHILKLLVGVHPLLDADGLEVGTPHLLQQLVVVAQHLVVQTAVGEAEGHSGD